MEKFDLADKSAEVVEVGDNVVFAYTRWRGNVRQAVGTVKSVAKTRITVQLFEDDKLVEKQSGNGRFICTKLLEGL